MATHDCPGGCGRQVQYHMYACKPCWYRLPAGLRAAIWEGYRSGSGHMEAMQDAADWYAHHPREVRRG